MSVIGIDFGGSNSRVAAAGKGGVDVLLNAISKRDNATLVSFGPKERHIGEAGLDLEVRNARNTVRSVKRFIGMHSEADAVAHERDFITCGIDSDDTESINFAVQYNDAYQTFRPEQILAMMLTQLKGIAVSNLPSVARPSCVLSCPAYYTQNQKQALLNACDIADIQCLGLLNETTAAAVDYGIFKIKEFPDDTTKPGAYVCFLDIGHTATTASIVSFYASEMKVIATCFDENLGCRNIDNLLLHHFRDAILKKHRIDVFENKKARIRLTQACQKVKTTLSANPVTSLSLECLMEDIDVHFPSFKREELEELIQEFAEKYEMLCQRIAQQFVNIAGEDISSLPVELIGGGSRIPIVKKITQNVFGSAPRTTLNATETISKGCAIHAAMLSPSYRVRDYKISDVAVYPAKIGYFSPIAPPAAANQRQLYPFLPNDINKIINIIKPGDVLPKALDISFERDENFDVFTFYDHSGDGVLNRSRVLPNQLLLNHSTVTNVGGDASAIENVISRHNKVKLRFKVSLVGSIDIASAQVITEYDRYDATEAMQTDENSEDAPPQEKKTKKERKTSQALIERHTIKDGMTADMVIQAKSLEKDMCAQDALVQRTAEARNSLETCFYYRYKIVDRDGELHKFTPPESVTKFDSMCAEASAWLESEEGEDANLEAVMSRLAPMQAIVSGAVARMRNFESLPISMTEFEAKLNAYRAEQSTIKTQENGGWHSDEELGRLESLLKDIESWYQSKKIDNAAQQLCADPILTPETLTRKLKEQERTITNLLRKPKPAPKPEPKKEAPKESAPKETQENPEDTAPEGTETE